MGRLATYCRALDCSTPALCEMQDGSGRWLWLCEHHCDLLAVGFPLRIDKPIEGP